MTSKVIEGHISPLLCKKSSDTFIHEPNLMKICMNDTIMKTQIFY